MVSYIQFYKSASPLGVAEGKGSFGLIVHVEQPNFDDFISTTVFGAQ